MTRTVFRRCNLFDGTGAAPAMADIAVEDGIIIAVGTGLDGDDEVAVDGRAILPGLFDCHVHVMFTNINIWGLVQRPFSLMFYEAAANLEATLATGITSVRDAGGADLGVKVALERGMINGPRMQISLSMLSQTGGHGDGWFPSGQRVSLMPPHPGRPPSLVDGTDEMRRKVRELIRSGADVIKVATSGGVMSPRDDPRHAHFTADELLVLVEEASGAGRFVMAHAQATEGIKNAIRSGIRSIEHGIYLDDEAIEMMLDAGTFLVPTLVAPQGVLDAAAAGAQIPEASLQKARDVMEVHRASFRRAVEAGVKVAMGTDAAVTPHGENLDEVELMVEHGMTSRQALMAASSTAAELMGTAEELGTVEPGKRADLVVLDGNPLDVTNMRTRVRAVYRDGLLAAGGI